MLTTLYKHPKRNRWYVLDQWKYPISSFDKPSKARKFRHLYRAYMQAPDHICESIMSKIIKLRGSDV